MTQNRDTLKVIALTERIGELVSQYEDKIAGLRAEATETISTLQTRIQELSDYVNQKEEQDTPEDPETA